MQVLQIVHPRTRALIGLTAAALAFATPASAAPAASASRWEILEAIHRVENPHNSTKPGPFGELGAYQFRAETWYNHTSIPFNRALDRQTSDDVAVKHFDWIKAGLERAGVEASAYNIAMAWNAGVTAVSRGTAPRVARDYATRVANIAAEIHTQAVAAPEPTTVAATRFPVPQIRADGFEFGTMTNRISIASW